MSRMASRAPKPPVSSRLRTQPASGQTSRQPSRPPSALGNASTSSTASQRELNDPAAVLPVPTPLAFPSTRSDSECNIQVVIRCRRRSSKEISESSPIVVTTNGPKSTEIVVQTESQTSALGIVQMAPTRTYPYDTVFGPEADQSLVYEDVVAPKLDEVINGYNCTIFAYGQTGTGKTYTMQGDLVPTPLGYPSPSAGMIPRALHKLFLHLNERFSDFTVKVSYIELYNEELRDLLSTDLPAPTSTAQPMGAGKAKESQREELKIWDDNKRGGVTISGLKEVFVKDAADAIAVLTKGTERRQVAATRFNDHSSRSHTVFTLQVHTKESSGTDEFVRSGKLNLVDLAGAENIGRSGAQNTRAREAGAINQSLLTLGRVITSLVEKAPHVPGRTKTCIIATISPARSNIEETLSTLDYAINAKSIRNRPEVNQRMTKNALMKECVEEIERLRSNLMAAREKNGIFFAEETWNEMVVEREGLESDLKDTRTALAQADSELRGSRADLNESLSQLAHRNQELAQTREILRLTQDELMRTRKQLDVMSRALDDEIIVRTAHQDTETNLDQVATQLRATVQQTIGDNTALLDELERKANMLTANLKVADQSRLALDKRAGNIQAVIDEFAKEHERAVHGLSNTATDLRSKQFEQLSTLSSLVKEQNTSIKEAIKSLHSSEKTTEDVTVALQSSLSESSDLILQGFDQWSAGFLLASTSLIKDIKAAGRVSCGVAENALDVLYQSVEALGADADKHLTNEARIVAEVNAAAEAAAADEIRRLKRQNASLTQLLEREQSDAERTRNDLVRRVSGMLEDYSRGRDASLRKAFTAMEESTVLTEQQWDRFTTEQTAKLDAHVKEGQVTSALIQRRRQDGKRKREEGSGAISSIASSFEQGLATLETSTSMAVISCSSEMQQTLSNARSNQGEVFEQLNRVKRKRLDTTTNTLQAVQQTYRTTREVLASTSQRVGEDVNMIISHAKAGEDASTSHQRNMSAAVSALRDIGATANADLQRDGSAGLGPQRRTYTYTDSWQLTADRQVLLQDRLIIEDDLIEVHSRNPSPLPTEKSDLKAEVEFLHVRPVTAATENELPSGVALNKSRGGKPLAEKPANIVSTNATRRR
ncbi:kinesin-domain-containing protein [Auriculariales sp. MPI-PUGE-AT-0066]|nr:kinesin-domain-containing protein [Auriculariales sp. MPI-PUGE-AT-0066]